jgi:hypothetical protein
VVVQRDAKAQKDERLWRRTHRSQLGPCQRHVRH